MTPLNAILNLSEALIDQVQTDLDYKERALECKRDARKQSKKRTSLADRQDEISRYQVLLEYSKIVWSSARMLSFLITSQMNHTKLNLNQLMFNF